MDYIGNIAEDETRNVFFTTNDGSGGATAPSSAFEAADVTIYKDNSATQKATTNGLTMTSPFDSIVGLHLLTVDTSNDTGDAGFWATGSDYTIVLNPDETVDSQTVVATLAQFSIEHRYMRGTDSAATASGLSTHDGKLDTVDANVDLILADTNELQSDDVPGLIAALNDVAATDIVSAGAITTLTGAVVNVDLVDTVTTNTDVRGTDNAATAAALATAQLDLDTITDTDGVLLGAAGVDLIWDEVLSGATHNVPSSAGRRLRALNDFGLYEGGHVWIDTVNGTAGTTDFENGTVNNPVDTIADAITLAASVGLPGFHVIPGSTITLAATMDNYEFVGQNWTLALGGQSIAGCTIFNATVSGTATGAGPKFTGCDINATTIPENTVLSGCKLSSTTTLGILGDCWFDQCYSGVAGTGTPSLDFGAAIANSNVSVRHYSGGIEVQNIGATGTDTMSLEGHGQIVLNANCAGGTIAIRGNFTVTDNAGGAVTLSDDARYDVDQINAQVDTAFTTQMADSVSTDGTIATREQALYMILQMLTDFSIAGTTLTVKKVDGSTSLMTYTLDDGTNPTSLTRAT